MSKRIYAAQKYRRERTDVVGVELVDADENTDGRRPEHPGQSPAEHGELAGVEVVDEDRVELGIIAHYQMSSLEQGARGGGRTPR